MKFNQGGCIVMLDKDRPYRAIITGYEIEYNPFKEYYRLCWLNTNQYNTPSEKQPIEFIDTYFILETDLTKALYE